jgi:glucan biosynthesis protein C
MTSSTRIDFLGNLRAFVIILVVVLHGSLTYMVNPLSWWYVVDPQNHLVFSALVLLIDVPIMQVMFFISGYFALPSLQKRGAAGFSREKFLRIGLPWVAGVLLLAPPTTYLIYLSRAVPVSLLDFWRRDFWGELFQQSVYWYLGVLLTMFLLLALVYESSQWLRNLTVQPARPGWKVFLGFGALMTAGYFFLNLFYHVDFWNRFWYLFVFQPVRLPLYAGYFCLGLFAQHKGWFGPGGYVPRAAGWLAASALSGLLYLGLRFSPLMATADPLPGVKLVNAILFNSYCLASLMAMLAVFQKWMAGDGPIWTRLANSSYGVYYFHPVILYPLTLALLLVDLPVLLKGSLAIVLGFGLTWLFVSQVVRRLPWLRDVF